MRLILFHIFLLFQSTTIAQRVDSVIIGNQSIRANLHKDRSLIDALYGRTDTGWVRLTEEMHIWVSALDPGGNLLVQAEADSIAVNKLHFGFHGIPESSGFWAVTIDELIAHNRDFNDNGVIDNPIPSIFSWPGYRNPFSLQYNGFAIDDPKYKQTAAPYFDNDDVIDDDDDVYRPDLGDAPIFAKTRGFYHPTPCASVFAPMYWAGGFNSPPAPVVHLGNLLLYHFQCCTTDFNAHSLMMEVKMVQDMAIAPDRIDSLQVGLYINSDLGGKGHERLGTADGGHVYFYQTDSNQIAQSGIFSSSVRFSDQFEDYDPEYQAKSMSIFTDNHGSLPAAQMVNLNAPATILNLLTNHWNDNTPNTSNGTGYNPGAFGSLSSLTYDGNPITQTGWLDTLTAPADRAVIQSNKNKAYQFSYQHENRYAFTWSHTGDAANDYRLISEQYPEDWYLLFTRSHWPGPKPYTPLHDLQLCDYAQLLNPIRDRLISFPNPSNGSTIFVTAPNGGLSFDAEVDIFSIDGSHLFSDNIFSQGYLARLDFNPPLESGIYVIRIKAFNQVYITKCIVKR